MIYEDVQQYIIGFYNNYKDDCDRLIDFMLDSYKIAAVKHDPFSKEVNRDIVKYQMLVELKNFLTNYSKIKYNKKGGNK